MESHRGSRGLLAARLSVNNSGHASERSLRSSRRSRSGHYAPTQCACLQLPKGSGLSSWEIHGYLPQESPLFSNGNRSQLPKGHGRIYDVTCTWVSPSWDSGGTTSRRCRPCYVSPLVAMTTLLACYPDGSFAGFRKDLDGASERLRGKPRVSLRASSSSMCSLSEGGARSPRGNDCLVLSDTGRVTLKSGATPGFAYVLSTTFPQPGTSWNESRAVGAGSSKARMWSSLEQ